MPPPWDESAELPLAPMYRTAPLSRNRVENINVIVESPHPVCTLNYETEEYSISNSIFYVGGMHSAFGFAYI